MIFRSAFCSVIWQRVGGSRIVQWLSEQLKVLFELELTIEMNCNRNILFFYVVSAALNFVRIVQTNPGAF